MGSWSAEVCNMRLHRLPQAKKIIFYLIMVLMAGCSASSTGSNPFSVASETNPSLNKKIIESAYQLGQSDHYLLISGSQLNQGLVLNGFERFMVHQRGSIQPYRLRDNYTALGYFVQNTGSGISKLCDQNLQFLAVAAAPSRLGMQLKGKSEGDIVCENGEIIAAIPLGYDAKVFAVSSKNTFATSIDLKELAKASSQANGNLLWSDLNPDWPSRPVRWIFAAQMPFSKHMKELGVHLPKDFLLASTYTQIFDAASFHPDALIYSFYSPSLNARLQGGEFRLLPVQMGKNQAAVMPSPATIGSGYPEILKTDIVMYVKADKKNSCIAVAFADFLLEFNKPILLESNMAPLGFSKRSSALKRVRQLLRSSSSVNFPPYCERSWMDSDGLRKAAGGDS